MIKESFIQQLKESAKIVDVISAHVDLKRRGTNWVGLCPFHTEKTPSFTVSESKNMWKCMGCGKGGDVYAFFKEKGLDFQEQVKEVARIMNIPVEFQESNLSPEEKAKKKEEVQTREVLFIQNQKYWEHLFQTGLDFPVVRYEVDQFGNVISTFDVFGREYSEETILQFGLAVAPVNWLVKEGEKAGFKYDTLLDGGLIVEKDGKKYDRFNGRLLFPIYISSHTSEIRGKIAGFGGRVNPKDNYIHKKAKYINSPETLIYEKSKILYGIHQTKAYIQQAKEGGSCYLLEGYTDVLTMWEYGFKNSVGKCGTSLTKEQAYLIKKYAREVILFPDVDPKYNDEGEIIEWPGLDAMRRNGGDIDTLLEAGLHVKIFIMPIRSDRKKTDPDSFLREHGAKALQMLLDEGILDALEWRVLDLLSHGDGKDVKERAAETASRMLAFIKSDYKRNNYIKTLCGAKFLKTKESILSEMVLNKMMEGQKRQNGREVYLSGQQEDDLYRYGIYIGTTRKSKNPIYMKLDGERPVPLANFRIEPEYHVYSDVKPERKIKIINENGLCRIIDLHTDVFEDFGAFRKAVASQGNFKFKRKHCRNEDFDGIVTKLYEEMPTVIRVTKLGRHNMDFYAWSNGVTLSDGTFKEMLENGTIQVDDNVYRLPGKNNQDEQRRLLDSQGNIDSHIDNFMYMSGECPSFHDWARLFCEVHGKNAPMAIAFYLLALFRSEIYPNLSQEIPILNGTGPPQKGKTQLWWDLSSMFGKPQKPINLNNFTKSGFAAKMEQTRDAIVGLDEFKNALPNEVHELLKSLSDGVGRERRSVRDNSLSTESTEILNCIYLFGQDLPTKDIALLTRCITLWFYGYEDTPDAIQKYQELKRIRMSGVLSQITSGLQRFRKLIRENAMITFSHVKGEIKSLVDGEADERILNSHAWPLTMVFILQDECQFPEIEKGRIFYQSLLSLAVDLVKTQMKNIRKEDETASFWLNFMGLALQGRDLRHKLHFVVDIKDSEKFYETETSKDTMVIEWSKPRKLIYIHLESCYKPYRDSFRGDNEKNPLPLESLRVYMEQNNHFLGIKKAKKVGNRTLSVMVFNIGEVEGNDIYGGLSSIGFDLPTTKEAMAKFFEEEGESDDISDENNTQTPKSPSKDDLPF